MQPTATDATIPPAGPDRCRPEEARPPIQQHIYIPQQTKQPISIGGWIGRSLISCIPLVGPLVYLIMLFVWAGDTTKEDSFRNWAKAQLIIMGIVVGLSLLVMLFAAIIASSY